MKRIRILLLWCTFILTPGLATADDGGWLEWLYKLDTKLVGVGTDIHLVCIDDARNAVRCEEGYMIPRVGAQMPRAFADLRHQIDFRVALYWKYGERFSDVVDRRSIKAMKLMGMYYYHRLPNLQLGAGAGYMPFFGEGFDLFSRGIVTPVSIVWAPFGTGFLKSALFFRFEESYIMQGFTGADFGNLQTRFSTNGEWKPSFTIGFDFRRRR